jgi:hypothetical protein
MQGCSCSSQSHCHPTILPLLLSTGNSHPTHRTGQQFHPMIESKNCTRYSYAERLIFSLQPIASAIDLKCSSTPTVVGAIGRIIALKATSYFLGRGTEGRYWLLC